MPAIQLITKEEPYHRLIPLIKGATSRVIMVIDDKGVIQYQSPPVKQLLGYTSRDITGKHLSELLSPGEIDRAQNYIEEMATKRKKFAEWYLRFYSSSGASMWLKGQASNFLDDPRLSGILLYWYTLSG